MAETALKFGPEWLRALSHPNPGTNTQNNQPLSTFVGNPPKYKLADYRYGREEMLALFDRNSNMPDSIKDLTMISSEKCQLPLAFVTMSDEEQRMWSRSVNSDGLTRIKGSGPAPTSAPRGRGGSVDRGRGRGRGTGAFYQRGSSFDDMEGPPGGISRTRGFERNPNSTERPEGYWEERERRFERPFPGRVEENGVVGRKEVSRGGGASDGWRGSTRETEKGRDEENGWRSVGRGFEKWNGKSWRSEKEEWDRGPMRDGEPLGSLRNGPSRHSKRSSSQIWDDETGDQLPEWSREDDCDAEQVGTFDSAGAFMETKEERISSSHETGSRIENEELNKENKDVEIDKVRRSSINLVSHKREDSAPRNNSTIASPLTPTELNNNGSLSTGSDSLSQSRTKNSQEEPSKQSNRGAGDVPSRKSESILNKGQRQQQHPQIMQQQMQPQVKQLKAEHSSPDDEINRMMVEASQRPTPVVLPQGLRNIKPSIMNQVNSRNMVFNEVRGSHALEKMPVSISHPHYTGEKPSEDDNFALLEKAAENMMAKWTAEEEQRTIVNVASQSVDKLSVLPIHHEDAYKWSYRDPQSLVQGPFTSQEMLEWFSAGYFTMSLMVRRGCDEKFSQLGELIRNWGRVPFSPSTSPPPALRAQQAPVNIPPQIPQTQGVVVPPPPTLSQPPTMQPHSAPLVPQQNPQGPDHEQQMRLMMLHQQLIQQQLLYKQHVQVQSLLGHLKQDESFSNLTPQQQQQVLLQHLIAQQQLQRYQKAAPAGMSDLPSLPDPLAQLQLPLLGLTLPPVIPSENNSLWSIPPNNAPNPPAWPIGPNQPKNPGNSIWDIEVPNQADLEAQHKASRERKVKEEVEEQRRLKEAEEERQKQLMEEQRLRMVEQEEKRRQEEERKREDEKRQMEEQKKLEEEHRRKEEERRILEERYHAIRLAEEQRKKQEEQMRKKMEEDLLKKQHDAELRKKKLKEDLARKEKEVEEKRHEEEKKEIERKIKQEIERQRELDRERETEMKETERRLQQQDLERQQQEALKKLQDQQKAKSQLPPWLLNNNEHQDNTVSLAQIQQLEKERLSMERQERQRLMQLELEREKHNVQSANQQLKNAQFSWAQNFNFSADFRAAEPAPVKTLLEIQQEEAEQLATEEKQQPKPVANVLSQSASGVWNNAANNLSWANSNRDGGWTTVESNNSSSRGFWDDAVNVSQPAPTPNNRQPPKAATKPSGESAFPALAKPAQSSNSGSSNKAKNIRAKKDEETVMKLFETHKLKNSDDFTQWCTKALSSMASSVDVPTFIAFLKDVESPYEVHDYVKSYLGEGKDAREFAKQFLERRSKYKNQTKNSSAEENMWGPAPAITPSQTKTPQQIHADFEVSHYTNMVGNGTSSANSKTKKKKTKKMQKLDMSMLGFTVQADPDRINVGEIDRLDAI